MSNSKKIQILLPLILVGFIVLIFWLKPNPTTPASNNAWQTFTDTKQGISFQYPSQLSTKYIFTQEWPPVVKIEQHPAYPCPTGSREIDGKFSYCVLTQTEGAAGSVYTSYVYSTGSLSPDKTLTISFTLRSVQCENYDDPQKSECLTERQTFDLDGVVDRIAHSVVLP